MVRSVTKFYASNGKEFTSQKEAEIYDNDLREKTPYSGSLRTVGCLS